MSFEREQELSLTLPLHDATGTLTAEELAIVQGKLWQFLGKQTRRFTVGDSSSIPVETAQDLMASIQFVLDMELGATGKVATLLLSEDIETLYQAGIKRIENKIDESKRLWESACITAPDIENSSYQDTLQSIGGFWKRYDYRLFAHHIPCDIDYQLCHPVSESLLGVAYLCTYLRHILTENRILHLFDRGLIIEILEQYCPDYKGLLINLCEPVITNAVGLALIYKQPISLYITEEDRLKLADLFRSFPAHKAKQALRAAAGRFCTVCGLRDSFTKSYVTQAAEELYPRISAALPSGNLDGIFIG